MPLFRLSGLFRGVIVVVTLVTTVAWSVPVAARSSAVDDPRFFAETGFRVGSDSFWDYFQHRGGVSSFGFPVSRRFMLLGFPVQFFQRGILQQRPDGSVTTMNLLDPGLMPYTQINFSIYPAVDSEITADTPSPGTADYGPKIVQFVEDLAPNEFDDKPVRFAETFFSTVSLEEAFPDGNGSPDLLPLINLEIWGAPTSHPTYDPNNRNFIYQRFQRGIMHYDSGCNCTQGLLLADYLKALLTGQNLPPDLAAQAADSPFLRQYDSSRPLSIARPEQLPGSDLTGAFEKDTAGVVSNVPTPQPGGTPVPSTPIAGTPVPSTPVPGVASYYHAASPEYGMGVFVWGSPNAERTLGLVRDMEFTWVKVLISWRDVEYAGKGQFDWTRSDLMVRQANDAGLKIIARLDFQPRWARADSCVQDLQPAGCVNNGPPDNYQDFADFVSALVGRYKAGSPNGQVQAIEVWNEVNLAREWGNRPINAQQAADYVRLLGAAYTAAKKADPSVTVVTAGLSPTGWNDDTARPDDTYLQWLYDAGMKGKYDALGAHGPGFKAPPEVSPEEAASNPVYGGHRSFTFRRIEDIRAIMERNGDSAKQVWVLEFGWTSDEVNQAYAWHRVSEQEKADYLVRSFQWAHAHWAPWIGVMTVWNMPDPAWGPQQEQYWWGVTNPDGSPRAAYTALQNARRNGTLP